MKRLLELLKPHWSTIALGAAFSLLVSIINGAFAFFIKTIVDDIFVMGDKVILFSVAIGIIVAFILRGTFVFFQNYLMFKVGSRVVKDVRNSLYARIVRLPMQYFGNDSRGSLMSKIINDAGILQELLAFRIKDFFVSIGTIVILTSIALYRRWDLTILALGVLPFAFYIVSILGKRLKKVSHKAQRKLAQITESLTEGLSGIKVIKSFGVEDHEAEKFNQKTNEYYLQFMKSTKILQTTVFLMEVVVGIGVAVIIYYGGLLVSDGTITSGDFFSFMAAILMIFTPAKRLAAVNNGLQQARAYVERIDEVLFSPIEEEGELEVATFNSEIAYENITFKYPGREDFALDGVNVKIKKGELVALVGRSGSGKSTFVDMLERFFDPQEGYIQIDGVDFRQFKRRALRSLSGVVSQNVILFNDTVKVNIAFGRSGATDDEIQAAAKTAYAHDFIMELPAGYDTMIGEGGSSLSGGQRQRISIARAVIKDPEILILDEATSSLDTQSEIMVQKAMDNLIESGGQKTLIVIAHRLSTIKRADRIIVLDKGKVIESGSHSELLKLQGMYSHLYSLQHGDHKHEGIDVSSL